MWRKSQRDNGFTLVEVLVALALFAVMSGAVLTTILAAIGLTRDDKSRLEGVSLATREIEITQDAFTSPSRGPLTIALNQVVNGNPLSGGVVGSPLVVDNIPYTVTRTAQWAPVSNTATDATTSTCNDPTVTALAYLKVHVEVTWPALIGRKPVALDTILTPLQGVTLTSGSAIGVRVKDRNASPVSGVTVTATGPSGASSGVTGGDGCAVIPFLTPATYAVTVQKTGYVNPSGVNNVQLSAPTVSGQIFQASVDYDLAATVLTSFKTVSGYPLPTVFTVPLSIANPAITPNGVTAVAGSGNARTLSNLWPYASGYTMWSGTCISNDPQTTGGTRTGPVTTAPGGTSSAAISLGPVKVTGATPGSTVSAYQAVDTACPASATYGGVPVGSLVSLGTASATGGVAVSLPYGNWVVKDSGGKSGVLVVPTTGAPATATMA